MRTLKALFISTFFSFNLWATGTPYSLNGEYHFSGETQSIFTKRYEPVYAFTQEGRRRLKDLRSQGWTCSAKPRQTYLCSKSDVAQGIPAHIERRADSMYSSMKVYFEEIPGVVDLITDAPSLKVFRIHKKVIFNKVEFPYFDYLILFDSQGQPQLHKVKWGEGSKFEEFVVVDENTLWSFETFSNQEKKYYDTFLIYGVFN